MSCVDGNPQTPKMTNGLCVVGSLHDDTLLRSGATPKDWVLALEVGEHIPKQYETRFLQNMDALNTQGVVMSWAHIGQGGAGHVNEQDHHYVISRMESLGYRLDRASSDMLRASAKLPWFQNNVFVFVRQL